MAQITTMLDRTVRRCRARLDWLALTAGAGLAVVGAFLSLTIIGAIVGIPLLLAALPLLTEPKHEVCR